MGELLQLLNLEEVGPMAAYYAVVQYVPDIVRGERINIGVVTFSPAAGEVRAHFIENWQRVNVFGSGVPGLRKIANVVKAMKVDDLSRAIEDWRHSVQFTEPSGSLLDVDALLVDSARRYLIDPEKPSKPYRNKQDAVNLTKRSVESAVINRIGRVGKAFVKPSYVQYGKFGRHTFDLALANGQPFLAVNALSFEVPYSKDLEKNLQVTEWAVRDVKDAEPDLAVAVMALPPLDAIPLVQDIFDRARNTISRLGADLVTQDSLEAWSVSQAERVAAHVQSRQ